MNFMLLVSKELIYGRDRNWINDDTARLRHAEGIC